MSRTGVLVLILFVGIALLDGIWLGSWGRSAVWGAAGFVLAGVTRGRAGEPREDRREQRGSRVWISDEWREGRRLQAVGPFPETRDR